MGKTSTTAKDKWNKNNYDTILIRVPKGRKADIERAAGNGQSLNGYIADTLRQSIGMSKEEWKAGADDK